MSENKPRYFTDGRWLWEASADLKTCRGWSFISDKWMECTPYPSKTFDYMEQQDRFNEISSFEALEMFPKAFQG